MRSCKLNIQTLFVTFWQSLTERTFFEKLKMIDWEAIFVRLVKSEECQKLTVKQALLAIQQYGLFLFLLNK
jgi:hypothetical protein